MTWLFVKGLVTGAWGLLKKVPLWVWALLGLLVIVYLYGEAARRSGRSEIQALWDKDKARNAAEISRIVGERGKVTTKVEYKTREVVKTIYVKGETRETVREVFVPVDSGYLSGGFRVFYDAAVTDTIPDPTKIADAAPIAITAVATNANDNYTLCHAAYAKVALWQEWAAEQCKKNKNGCPDGEE